MDLYEALKKGTKEEELKALFEKDLAAARAKLEQEAAKNKRKSVVELARKKVSKAFTEYLGELIDDADEQELENVNEECEEALKQLETYFQYLGIFTNRLPEVKGQEKKNSDQILKEFFKKL